METQENTGYKMGSTSHQSSSSGGANEGSISRTQQDKSEVDKRDR